MNSISLTVATIDRWRINCKVHTPRSLITNSWGGPNEFASDTVIASIKSAPDSIPRKIETRARARSRARINHLSIRYFIPWHAARGKVHGPCNIFRATRGNFTSPYPGSHDLPHVCGHSASHRDPLTHFNYSRSSPLRPEGVYTFSATGGAGSPIFSSFRSRCRQEYYGTPLERGRSLN